MAVAQRIYANALFEAAKEKGNLDTVRQELEEFLAAMEQVPELRALLETRRSTRTSGSRRCARSSPTSTSSSATSCSSPQRRDGRTSSP